MPDYTKEESFQKVLKSRQYLDLSPEDRKEFLGILQGLTPQERTQLASGLEQGTIENPQKGPSSGQIGQAVDEFLEPARPTPAKVAQMGIGALFGAGSGAVATKLAGQVASPLLKKAIPPIVETGANYLANQTSKAVGAQEGAPFEHDMSDAVSVALPLGVRGVAGLAKATTRPAQRAIREADETNVALQDQYRQDVSKTDTAIQRKVAEVDETTALANQKNVENYQRDLSAWKAKDQEIKRNLQAEMGKIRDNTSLSNQQKTQEYRAAYREYRTRLDEHNDAFKNFPGEGRSGVDTWDYAQEYQKVKDSAPFAQPRDVSALRDTARELGVEFRTPAPGVQSKFPRITDALQDFGMTEEGPVGVGVDRLIATQKRLGQIIGKSSGDEKGAAKRLWTSVDDLLDQAARSDPIAKEAVEASQDARYGFMREMTMQDWEQMFRRFSQPTGAGNREMASERLRKYYEDTFKQDRFNRMALTNDEWSHLDNIVERLPVGKVGKAPSFPSLETPDYSKVTSKVQGPQPQPKPEVKPDYEGATYPDYPEPPEPVKPDLGNFPVGKAIMGKVAGGMAGGLAAEAMGFPTYHGIVAGSAAGAMATGGPWLISKLMLRGEAGQQAVRNIMAGKKTVGHAELALLTQAAKQLGIDTNE